MKEIMAFLLTALSVFGAFGVSAAALTANSGQVYQNVEIQRISDGKLTINHDGGKAVLNLEDLPENFVAALSARQRYALQSQVDLTLTDGRKLARTNIMELGNDKVILACTSGVLEVPAKLLPQCYLRTFTPFQMKALRQKEQTTATTLHATTDPKAMPPAVSGETGVMDKKDAPVATEVDAQGRTIYTGPRGGRYYLKPDGKKVYLPKKKEKSENKTSTDGTKAQ